MFVFFHSTVGRINKKKGRLFKKNLIGDLMPYLIIKARSVLQPIRWIEQNHTKPVREWEQPLVIVSTPKTCDYPCRTLTGSNFYDFTTN